MAYECCYYTFSITGESLKLCFIHHFSKFDLITEIQEIQAVQIGWKKCFFLYVMADDFPTENLSAANIFSLRCAIYRYIVNSVPL